MSDLSAELRKVIGFDEEAAFRIARKSKSLMDYGFTSCAVDAIEAEHARLRPVLLAMVELTSDYEILLANLEKISPEHKLACAPMRTQLARLREIVGMK